MIEPWPTIAEAMLGLDDEGLTPIATEPLVGGFVIEPVLYAVFFVAGLLIGIGIGAWLA